MQVAIEGAAQRRPLSFIPGCNTPPEATREHVLRNTERDLPWLEVLEPNGRSLAIVAGGPSLKHRWPEVRQHDDVMALNNAYGFLLERGIVPDSFMLLDARADNAEFVRGADPSVRHFLAAQCHPEVFDALERVPVTLYLTTMPGIKDLTAHIKNRSKVQISGSVGTVGVKALGLAYALGYRDIHLYGYDSSYSDGEHHAFPQPLNDSAQTIEVFLGDRRYVTTPTLAHQATEFCGYARELIQFYGCQIELHCSGLLPDMVATANAEGAVPLEQRERQKYEQMWTVGAYREHAPGESHADVAPRLLGMAPGDSVIDFGCGTGRGAQKLLTAGYAVTGVDFADNCRDPGCTFPFVRACLWELPDGISADWGFCTDVMEHIPREKVPDVLAGIAARTRGAYFNISCHEDRCGAHIGRKLHMTVMDACGWIKELERHWLNVSAQERGGDVIAVCHNPRRNSGR